MADITGTTRLAELLAKATPGPYDLMRGRNLIRAIRGDLAVPLFEVVVPYGDPDMPAPTVRLGGKIVFRANSIDAKHSAAMKRSEDNGKYLLELLNALPTLLSTIATQAAEIERLTKPALEGSALDQMEWAIGIVASGDIDHEAREKIHSAMFDGMAELRRMQGEIERLRGALEPFAKAAMGVEAFAPEFPADGAALRASFDWYDKAQSEPLKRNSVRRRDLDAARAALTQQPKDDGHD